MKNKVALVAANYYEDITKGLINGVKNELDPSFEICEYQN